MSQGNNLYHIVCVTAKVPAERFLPETNIALKTLDLVFGKEREVGCTYWGESGLKSGPQLSGRVHISFYTKYANGSRADLYPYAGGLIAEVPAVVEV